MKEFMKKAYTNTKAAILAILTIGALAIASILISSLIFTLADKEYIITLDTLWRSFMAVGCGAGLAAIYRDMLDYLGKD